MRVLDRIRAASAAALCMCLLANVTPVAAQATWPAEGRPIRWVGPGSAGSTSDVLGRIVADHVSKSLGVPIVIEQKTGGGTLIAAEHVARSAPDGNTYMISSVAPLAIAPALYRNSKFDPLRDVVGVARLVTMSNVVVVNKDLPIKSVQDLVAYAKARPGQVNYGAVSGTSSHFSHVLLANQTGTQFTFVPYKTNTDSMMAVMKGEVTLTIDNALLLVPQIKGGTVRALAVTGDKRLPELPDVPTMVESGLAGYDVQSWFGLVTPVGTPAAIIERMSAEVNKALASPEVAAQIRKLGAEPAPQNAAAFDAFFRQENARWAPIVRQSGATAN